jgi:DNA repair photolyase
MTAERDLFDITTGTGNFIANGVISHNCYARPSHAYLGLSPGLDFETRIFAKTNAAKLLRKELSASGYRCSVISLGANTDPYQPAERDLRITRSILEVLVEFQHPFTIVTKSALVERDVDLIAPMAAKNLARVFVSVTNLDAELARKLEPRAAAPYRRLGTITKLTASGVPCGVLVAPVIPFLNDGDLEAILAAAAEAGARWAGYIVLRLPHELKGLFKEWLDHHHPQRAERIMARIRDLRGGKENDPRFGVRMAGTGEYAQLIRQRFERACRENGLESGGRTELDIQAFRVPRRPDQLPLL